MSDHASILRSHANFLREMASSYRKQPAEGPQYWLEYQAKEAVRLDEAADFYAAWAERLEARKAEDDIEHAA